VNQWRTLSPAKSVHHGYLESELRSKKVVARGGSTCSDLAAGLGSGDDKCTMRRGLSSASVKRDVTRSVEAMDRLEVSAGLETVRRLTRAST
jgi:hypothetical protein